MTSGVKGTLRQKIYFAQLAASSSKNTDEFQTDVFTFLFRVDDTFQAVQEPLRGVNVDNIMPY